MDDGSEATVKRGSSARSGEDLARLCGEVAAIFSRAWGRGPAKTTAHWAGPHVLIVLLENGHTDAERTLRAAGHIQQLIGGRHLLQTILEGELKASVERTLGRRVETMLSATRLDPDLSAEIFLLAPRDVQRETDDGDRDLLGRATEATARAHELGDEARALAAQRRQTRKRAKERREPGD